MKIKCTTLFDITNTGVTGKFRPSTVPFSDFTGRTINNVNEWNFARNQQRNYETLLQLISLRTQPMELESVIKKDDRFEFTFEIETTDVFLNDDDSLALLKQDANGVPMVTGLTERVKLLSVLCTEGDNANIWFVQIKE